MPRRLLPLLALTSVALPASTALADLPLQPNEAVTTFRSGFNGVTNQPFVVGVVDIRDPACNAPGLNTNWEADIYGNAMADSPTGQLSDEWTSANLGEVFGVALDDADNPNIYVTATSSYGNGATTGNVYRLDGTDGSVTTLATLPNTGPGLGNIAFDRANQQLFVTNFEDGSIYRLGMDGTILQVYDPFGADDGAPGFAPRTERIWGVQVFDCHLYFGTWSEDSGNDGDTNTVWSLSIAADGSLAGPEELQLTQPLNNSGRSMPISDIAFSTEGLMMVAERGMSSDFGQAPHQNRILEYAGGHSSWVPSGQTFSLGNIAGGTNSSGGVDYDCVEDVDECNTWGANVLAMADALRCCSPPNIYGLQVMPATGGAVTDSYIIDLDNETTYQDKTAIGDVDSVRPCFAVSAACDHDPGCTNDKYYWIENHAGAEDPENQIPWPVSEDTALCGSTWVEVIHNPFMGDAWQALAYRWIAASLNVATGADTTPEVDQALVDGEALLAMCSVGPADQDAALAAADVLASYNAGLIGPGVCVHDGGDAPPPEPVDPPDREDTAAAVGAACSVGQDPGWAGFGALLFGLIALRRRRD
ncbi:MAG: hypothetical protein AAF799_09965 [Myxococcota bacterium]